MTAECIECMHDLETVQGPRSAAPTWRCEWCGRSGVFAQGVTRSGKTFAARIEHDAGDVRKRKPWVRADRVRYAERVGR